MIIMIIVVSLSGALVISQFDRSFDSSQKIPWDGNIGPHNLPDIWSYFMMMMMIKYIWYIGKRGLPSSN